MPGGDENSAKDMGVVIRNTALIQRQIESALLVVHHAGKDAERGLRGSSGLPGATDAIIRVSRTDDRATLSVEKQKDAEDGQKIHLRAQIVSLPPANGSVQPRSSLIPDGGRGASCGNEGEADADRATRAPVSGRSDRR